MKRKIIKKIGTIVVWSIGSILLDLIILILLMLIPSVQTFVAQQLALYFSNELHVKINIERIYISPSLDVVMNKVYISDQHYNPMIVSEKMIVDITNFNPVEKTLSIRNILLNEPEIYLKKYATDSVINLQFIVDYFSSKDTIQQNKKWTIKSSSFSLENAHFCFDNFHKLPLVNPKNIDFNRLNIRKINAKFSSIAILQDTIKGNIDHFSMIDSSGFWIKKLSGKALFCNGKIQLDRMALETPNSKLYANMAVSYNQSSDFEDFTNRVFFNIKIFNSSVNTKDISFFMKDSGLFENKIKLKAHISGSLNQLSIKEMVVSFGSKSSLSGNVTIHEILQPDKIKIDGFISNLSTNIEDIQQIKLPKNKSIKLPTEIAKIGKIVAKGKFNGTLQNFTSKVDLTTSAGSVGCDILFNTHNKKVSYTATVQSTNFDFSIFFPNSGVKKTSIHTDITGTGLSKSNIDVKINGNIEYIEYRDYVFKNSKIDGNYSNKIFFGHILIDDPMLFLDFNGTIDYSNKIPRYQFIADVEHAKLVELQLINRHISSQLSTHLNATIEGDKFDDFVGEVKFFDTKYFEKDKMYELKKLDVISSFSLIGYRSIDITSDWIDLTANGKFQYSDLGNAFNYILKKFLPSYVPEKIGIDKLVTITNNSKKTTTKSNNSISERRFLSFDINVKDSDPISELFVPSIKAKGKTSISGFLNTITQHIEFQLNTDTLNIGELSFEQIEIKGNSIDSLLNLDINCKEFALSRRDTLIFSNIHSLTSLKNDSLQFSLLWNNNNTVSKQSLINGMLVFSKTPIIKGTLISSNIYLNDSLWNVNPRNSFFVDSKSFGFSNLQFYSKNKQVMFDGIASHNPDDVLKVKLVDFNISEADEWTSHRNFDLDGIVNGEVELSQIFDKFSIITNLKILSLGLNGQKLGNANVVSAWDARKNGLFVNIDVLYRGNVGEAKPVTIQGYFYPKNGALDLQADLLNFKLKVIEKYLQNLFYRVDGLATGKINIIGTINRPQIEGKIKLMRSVWGVNFLNIEYTINQEIELSKNRIKFDSLTAYDTRNNIAVVNGYVSHEDFKNFKLDLNIKTFNFMGLNTTRSMNELFYGKAFATGAIHIFGTAPNIQIDAQLETNNNTEISVPISSTTVVDKSSFINFVSKQLHENQNTNNSLIDLGLKMNFLVNVTPSAKFHIFLDPSTGGSLHGSGNGNIRLNINTNGDFNMYGTYTISKGQYEMKLKDIVTRTFEIENGGTIQWNGNPTDADIDIKAVFPTSASLSSILAIDSSSSTGYNRKVKVLSVLKLSGKLLNPEVRFGIELPNSDNTTRTSFYNLIDTTNDQNMIRQTFSLLVLGRFEPENNQSGNIVGEGVGMSSMELISNQLSNFVSQVSNDINVGFNYKMADQITTEELQIAVSTQILNDRVTIEGNVSAGGQNKYVQNTNNVVGDIIVEVKLTSDGKWRTKMYNVANTNEYTYQNAPYVQGLGFIYRVDFNKLSEIFKKNKQ
ncbi:MAG: translocation/assembly module TamB domain-containing protein [Bacteroidota bacterium]